jgi:coenzyme F420-reducing hydrogenase beta subunit
MSLYSPRDIVQSGLCIGCGICVAQARNHGNFASMEFDKYGQLKPLGPRQWYNQPTEEFSAVCPFSPVAANENSIAARVFPDVPLNNVSLGRYNTNFVGYVAEDNFRKQGSSGGMVSWVASELLQKGLVDGVAHVVSAKKPQDEGRFFRYRISRTESEIHEGAKSRYYPIELSEILTTIKETPGRYAVVALPCMIKAIQLLRQNDSLYRERICYTLGLFCGHMKSARFVESLAWQMNIPVEDVKQVEFRNKYPDHPANWYNASLHFNNGTVVNKDWWHLSDGDWGAGFFMNSACNFCDDVVAETADISFGDAWVEPYSSDWKGTNVVVIRSAIIKEVIMKGRTEARLQLEEVSPTFVAQTQAAGLRQRRQGLAYRLTWTKFGLKPPKRVTPDASRLAKTRKILYRIRYMISKWSHRMFWFARKTRMRFIYLLWARTVSALYYGVAYHGGSMVEMVKRYREFLKN